MDYGDKPTAIHQFLTIYPEEEANLPVFRGGGSMFVVRQLFTGRGYG